MSKNAFLALLSGCALVLVTWAAGLVGQLYAQPTNLAPFETNITVGTTATMAAVPANPSRKGLILCNSGAATVNVTFGSITPTVTTGVALPGSAAVNSCLNLMPYMAPNVAMGAQINVIAAAAGTATALEF